MAVIVAEFFEICGLETASPANLGELIPYLLTVLAAVALVSGVFRAVGRLAEVLLNSRRF